MWPQASTFSIDVLPGAAEMVAAAPIAQVGYGVSVLTVHTEEVTGTAVSAPLEPDAAVIIGIQPTAPVVAAGDPLVCPECKTAFQYDYPNRRGMGAIDEGPQTPSVVRFSVVTGCDGSNCKSQVELIALRSRGTTKEQCVAEMAAWTVDGILCARGHQIVLPDPQEVREWLNEPDV